MSKLSNLLKSLLGPSKEAKSDVSEATQAEPKIESPALEPKAEDVVEKEQVVIEPVAPEPKIEAVPVTLKNKAGVIYATCGNCGSMWNLKDQISRSKRPDVLSHLICPSCDKPVKLPAEILLKK